MSDTQWLTGSACVDDIRLFPVWHHNQLRLHHAYAESEWEHVPEHRFQHRRLNYRHYLPFPNRCDQQRWDEDGRRQDLYYALALGALTAGLQKVSAVLEASKPALQVVNNPWSRMELGYPNCRFQRTDE